MSSPAFDRGHGGKLSVDTGRESKPCSKVVLAEGLAAVELLAALAAGERSSRGTRPGLHPWGSVASGRPAPGSRPARGRGRGRRPRVRR